MEARGGGKRDGPNAIWKRVGNLPGKSEPVRNRYIAYFIGVTLSCHVNGQLTWRKTYGGHGVDNGRSVRQAPDGGYAVLGSTGSFGAGGSDFYLLKLYPDGEIQWSSTYGSAGIEQGYGLRALPDGFALVGFASSDGDYQGMLVRTDADGGQLWQRNYGSQDWDFLYSIDTAASGFFLAGKTYTGDGYGDAWLLRTDVNGDTLWTRHFGTAFDDEARDVKATPDGGCIVAAILGNADGTTDAALVKFSAAGGEEWRSVLGGASDDRGEGVALTTDGGYVLGGSTKSYSEYSEMLLAKVAYDGTSTWVQHIGQIADWMGRGIVEREDGGLMLVGFTEAFGNGGKDAYLLYTDSAGFFEQGRTYGGTEDDEGWAVEPASDGGVIIAGENSSVGPGPLAVYVVKGDTVGMTVSQQDDPVVDPLPVNELGHRSILGINPNIVRVGGLMRIAGIAGGRAVARIIGVNGAVWKEIPVVSDGDVSIQVPDLAPGLYLLKLITADGRVGEGKFIVLN